MNGGDPQLFHQERWNKLAASSYRFPLLRLHFDVPQVERTLDRARARVSPIRPGRLRLRSTTSSSRTGHSTRTVFAAAFPLFFFFFFFFLESIFVRLGVKNPM